MSTGTRRRVYRSASTTRSFSWLIVGALVFGVIGAASAPARVFALVATVALLLMAWRYWNVGVHVEEDGLKLAGLFGSKRIGWESVERFEVSPNGIYPYSGYLVRNDGHPPTVVYGLGAPARPKSRLEDFRRQVQTPVDELNQVIADRRQTDKTVPTPPASVA